MVESKRAAPAKDAGAACEYVGCEEYVGGEECKMEGGEEGV